MQVVFSGDTKSLDSAFKRTRSESDSFAGSIDSTASKTKSGLGKMGGAFKSFAVGALAGFGLDALVNFGGDMLTTFENIEAAQRRAEVVFGSSTGMVKDFAASIDQFTGYSTNQIVGFTAAIGDILVPMGFTRDRAAELSTQLVDLATKLGLAAGVPFEQAITATTSALVGEYDSMKSLGVQLDAATVQSLLAAQGKGNLTGAAQKQAEAEVVLQEILRQTADAQALGTAKMAEGGTASANLSTALANLKDKLAEQLGPTLASAAGWLGDVAMALMDTKGSTDGLNPSAVEFAGTLRDIADSARDVFDAVRSVTDILAKLNSIKVPGWLSDITLFGGQDKDSFIGRGGLIGAIRGKAIGGSVSSGMPYWVGEKGPELMVPGASGTIIPNHALGSGSGGGSTNAPVVVVLQVDGREMARVVAKHQGQSGYMAGAA